MSPSRFAYPPTVANPSSISRFAPNQARAPKGTAIGGQWIDTPGGMLRDLGGGKTGMLHPHLSPGDAAKIRAESPDVSSAHLDENGQWTPERRMVHEQIVNQFLDGVEPAAPGEAEVWFNGGGPGSGKGSFTSGAVDVGYPSTRSVDDATGEMDFAGMPKPGAVLIDPDSVKMQLPEVKAMRKKQAAGGQMANPQGPGGNWAGQSHEESSYVAKMIYAEAQRRNLPVVYDGTGTKIVDKAQQALGNGYKAAHANYMYAEPNLALQSAIVRAGRIGRNVPKDMQAQQYVDMPGAFGKTVGSGIFSTVGLYDRNGLAKGQPIPKIFEVLPSGERKILDQAAYDKFLTSGTRLPDLT